MLALRSIGKHFPGVVALDDISLWFAPGEIHALVGENGAGKSTLIKIVTGIYQPDAGKVFYEGQALRFRRYRDSLDRRIGIDIGAKAQIHRLIWELAANEGKAIILISSDVPEIIGLAERILVFKDRRIVHEIADIHRRGLNYDVVSGEIGRYLN